ncbi:MAG: hypothetical protein GWN00_12390 [Aliifodinibius sp.]|nr:hypothetical protein [Fodinibius sp.]NIV11941.1 hypothetical protein [Fodinibius sp.]NIY25577.1 hypothetical protein [Fodinibius sp.]
MLKTCHTYGVIDRFGNSCFYKHITPRLFGENSTGVKTVDLKKNKGGDAYVGGDMIGEW